MLADVNHKRKITRPLVIAKFRDRKRVIVSLRLIQRTSQ